MMPIHLGGIEPPSAGYQPTALPLSYRWVADQVGLEPTASLVNSQVLSPLSYWSKFGTAGFDRLAVKVQFAGAFTAAITDAP